MRLKLARVAAIVLAVWSLPVQGAMRGSAISINGVQLPAEQAEQAEQLARAYGLVIPDGRYWYDATSGAWGLEGGPTAGFGHPGLALPGPMPPDISGGGTAIFFNGRELHPEEQLFQQRMFGTTIPGRYTLDAAGNVSVENGPFIANLRAAARPQGGGATQSRFGSVAVDGGGAMFFSRGTGSFNTR